MPQDSYATLISGLSKLQSNASKYENELTEDCLYAAFPVKFQTIKLNYIIKLKSFNSRGDK